MFLLHPCCDQKRLRQDVGWSGNGHWRESRQLRAEIRGSAPDAGKIPGVLNGISMPVGAMEKALYSSYTLTSLSVGYTPVRSATFAIIAVIVVSCMTSTPMTLERRIDATLDAPRMDKYDRHTSCNTNEQGISFSVPCFNIMWSAIENASQAAVTLRSLT